MNLKTVSIFQALLFMLMYLPLLETDYIVACLPDVDNVVELLQYIDAIIILALYFYRFFLLGKIEVSPFSLVFATYLFVAFISTVLNDGSIYFFVRRYWKAFLIVALCELTVKTDWRLVFVSFLPLLVLLIFLNLITQLLFPNGMYYLETQGFSHWVLGYKNTFIDYIFPAMMLVIAANYIGQSTPMKRVTSIGFCAVCFLSVILADSDTSIILVALLSLVLLFPRMLRLPYSGAMALGAGLNIGFYLLVVVLRLQSAFSWFLVDVLGKDITLNNRTLLWDRAIRAVNNAPLFGFGVEDELLTREKLGETHTHNMFIWQLYSGGPLLLGSFLLLIVLAAKSLCPYWSHPVSRALGFVLFALLFFWQVDGCFSVTLFFCLSFITLFPKAFFREERN